MCQTAAVLGEGASEVGEETQCANCFMLWATGLSDVTHSRMLAADVQRNLQDPWKEVTV